MFAVAICGTKDFDVKTIDPATVKIYVAIGAEGVPPLRWSYEDVATPYTGSSGGGHALGGDGYLDLVFHFDTLGSMLYVCSVYGLNFQKSFSAFLICSYHRAQRKKRC